ncbi:MAG: diacylglycerol kinase [Fimbriimonadia bacterium]
MKGRRHNPFEPFRVALEGVIHTFRTQRHMRFHFYTVVVVLVLGMFYNLHYREILILLFTISMVLMAEMFNSAIEAVVDLVQPTYHPMAKFAKDIAAGAVLITTVNAIVVGSLLFIGDTRLVDLSRLFRPNEIPQAITLKSLVGVFVVFALVVIGKALGRRGSLWHGGLISGHSALGFFFAIGIVILAQGNILVQLLAVMLGLLVAQSRWEAGIHSLFEVGLGATVGSVLAAIIYGLSAR